jgi:hypothetical protein
MKYSCGVAKDTAERIIDVRQDRNGPLEIVYALACLLPRELVPEIKRGF